ncbi:MAG: O-antigen ligase family protein, partial [Parabacteroides sp.]|nr:O-antigen ligase family protein [Parabacteroides sp.]
KVFWFHLSMLCMVASLFSICFFEKELRFSFSLPDGLILGFAGITLATYNWSLNPEPEKLIFGGQLLVWWFALRFLFEQYKSLRFYFLFIFLLTGWIEAVWGLLQLHGYSYSNHSLFRLTGSFFNPGPYSGYLAITLPIGLWMILRFEKLSNLIGWICTGTILLILPAGMSRSAWLAAFIACSWLFWVERIGWEKTKTFFLNVSRKNIFLYIILIIGIGTLFFRLYNLKKDSADGRLLMWKVTELAICEHPIQGVGLGGFPATYANEQASYFNSGQATVQEKFVAGCPEYAFNEYLQIGLEQGTIGLFLFLLWIGITCLQGIRSKQYGAVGSLIALALFALSSYPLQLPSFWVVLLFLGAICVTQTKASLSPIGVKVFVFLLLFGSVTLFWRQKKYYKAYREWKQLQLLYKNNAYTSVTDDYVAWHKQLKHKPEFLFEEAQCLHKTERYKEAIHVLEQAKQLSGDPMIRYMSAKNWQELKNYPQAESELLQSISILPERIYPYFLLTKLYAEPDFYQPKKLREAAKNVLNKKAKVESSAIREMRKEINQLLIDNVL